MPEVDPYGEAARAVGRAKDREHRRLGGVRRVIQNLRDKAANERARGDEDAARVFDEYADQLTEVIQRA